MPPSAERLMSSKKRPQSVGEILWPGWSTATEIFAGWEVTGGVASNSAPAANPIHLILFMGISVLNGFLFLRVGIVFGFGGIVIRIARGHLGADVVAPFVQTIAQFFDLVRHPARQVVLFANVFARSEEHTSELQSRF